MNTYRLSDQNTVDFYSAPIGKTIEEYKSTLPTIIDKTKEIVKSAEEMGMQTTDAGAQLVMQHSLIVGAVGGLLLYALTSRALYAAIGVVAGYILNSALDKSAQTQM